MILIDEIFVDEEILTTKYCCHLDICEGACCTFPGEWGAPLLEIEIPKIENCLEQSKKYLSERSLNILKEQGFVEWHNSPTTVCIEKKDCVFVYYEGKIAKCALEKAFLNGETDFKKPISCHLFPIRVRYQDQISIYYQRIDECESALNYGKEKNIYLVDFLKEPLSRAFGDDWYNLLHEYFLSVTKPLEI